MLWSRVSANLTCDLQNCDLVHQQRLPTDGNRTPQAGGTQRPSRGLSFAQDESSTDMLLTCQPHAENEFVMFGIAISVPEFNWPEKRFHYDGCFRDHEKVTRRLLEIQANLSDAFGDLYSQGCGS